MNVTFGLCLDGFASADPRPNFDEVVCGPVGLMRLLELRLGLVGVLPSHGRRVVGYRDALAVLAAAGPEFYSASFAQDDYAVAETLLRWRDELVLAGWDGLAAPGFSPRLATLAAVEATLDPTLRAGEGDRLRTIAVALADRSPQFDRVTVADPLDELPVRWRQLLQKLGAKFLDADAALTVALGASDTDLGKFQRLVSGVATPPPFRGDGSLNVVRAYSTESLALAAAQWRRAAGANVAVVEGADLPVLDAALARTDEPVAGVAARSVHRAIPQVLPLALRPLWRPLDPQHLLEFLMHPVCPVTGWLRHRLAEALREAPGVGGAPWQEALELARQAVRKQFAADPAALKENLERIQSDLNEWITLAGHDPVAGAPGEAIADACARVARWAGRRANSKVADSPEAALFCGLAAAAGELGDLTRTRAVLTRAQVERLLRLIQSTGWAGAPQAAELGVAPVRAAGAFVEPVDAVLWWDASERPTASTAPWTTTERDTLHRAGIELLPEAALLKANARLALRPLLAARRRLVLFQPLQRAGEKVGEHPLITRLRALPKEWNAQPLFRDLDREALADAPITPLAWTKLEPRPLPRPQRCWQLPPSAPIPAREYESYTSLSSFIFTPHDYVLDRVARLRAGPLAGASVIPDFRLFGNLIHRLTERMFAATSTLAWPTATEEQLARWLAVQWPTLLPEEGATLLLPGRQSESVRLQETAQRALVRLLEVLRAMRAVSVKPDVEPERRTFRTISATGKPIWLTGRVDLLVTDAEGRQVVVDLKLGGADKRTVELEQNRALQLAVYGFLVAGAPPFPPGVFLILNNQKVLTDEPGLIAGEASILSETGASGPASCWQDFLTMWDWRRKQLDRGLIEVSTVAGGQDATAGPPDLAPPLANWIPTKADAVGEYSPYGALIGWEEEQ